MQAIESKAEVLKVKNFRRQFCPNGCRMFDPDDEEDVECGECPTDLLGKRGYRYDDLKKPYCEAIYFELDDWVERQASIPECAKYLFEWYDRARARHVDGEYRNSSDGSILGGTGGETSFLFDGVEDINLCWPFEQCNDGVVKYTASSRAMVPITYHCHAYPPWMRQTFGSTYLAGVLPHGAKNMQVMLKPGRCT